MKKATAQNGFASASNGLLTNAEINQDVALRAKLQDDLPSPTKVLCSPDAADCQVTINTLRSDGRRHKDSNRLYASGTNQLSRRLFEEKSPAAVPGFASASDFASASAVSPQKKPSTKRSFGMLGGDEKKRSIDLTGGGGMEVTIGGSQQSVVSNSVVTSDELRPYRVAVIRRMKEKPSERGSLQRLHGILSGREDQEGVNIRTIAFDSIDTQENWTDEYRLNEIIDVMISFFE